MQRPSHRSAGVWVGFETLEGRQLLSAYQPWPAPAAEGPHASRLLMRAVEVEVSAKAGKKFSGEVARLAARGLPQNPKVLSATIDWGDGSAPTEGKMVRERGGGVHVRGAHRWSASGDYPMTVTIRRTDRAGLPELIETRANVKVKRPAVMLLGPPNIPYDPPVVEAPLARPIDDSAAASLADGINRFGLDLFAKLAAQRGGQNVFVSPYSIATALGMLGEWDDPTASAIEGMLHQAGDAQSLGDDFAAMLGSYAASHDGQLPYDLTMANAAWMQDGSIDVPLDYLQKLSDDFSAKLATLDFAHDTGGAVAQINQWVSDQTQGRIPHLIDSLDRDTQLVLTNAVYFKGKWKSAFKTEDTRSRPFTLGDGSQEQVAMMQQTGDFAYYGDGNVQVVELPYEGDDLSMVLVLPRQADGLGELANSLTADELDGWLGLRSMQQVALWMPRFSMDTRFDLAGMLAGMGMPTQLGPMMVSKVVHQANIDVDEEGTVAAAATGIGISTTAYFPPTTPIVFNADHPFLFAIRDRRSGGLVFMGQVSQPPPAPAGMSEGGVALGAGDSRVIANAHP